jgi:hypothetical protein
MVPGGGTPRDRMDTQFSHLLWLPLDTLVRNTLLHRVQCTGMVYVYRTCFGDSPSLPDFGSLLPPSFLLLQSRIAWVLTYRYPSANPIDFRRTPYEPASFSAAPFQLIACSYPKAALTAKLRIVEFFESRRLMG